MKRTIFICAFFVLLSFYVFAQPRIIIHHVDVSTLPNIKTYVSVLNQEGNSILGLDKSNFCLIEDGNSISNFRCSPIFPNREWNSIVLAIDKSGSMRGNAIQEAKKGAKLFLQKIGLQDQISLVIFDKTVSWKTDFIRDKKLVEKEVDSIYPQSNTSFYDAVIQALDRLSKVQSSRKALVILTDGKDTESKSSLKECLDKAEKAKIPIYLIGLGKEIDRKIINSVAEASRGNSVFATSSQELQSIYSSIAAQLKNQYILEHRFSGKERVTTHLLEIQVFLGNLSIKDRIYYSY